MPLRSWKMYGFILGFHRRVWWPKWTPASSRARMETTDMGYLFCDLRAAVPGRPASRYMNARRPGGQDMPGISPTQKVYHTPQMSSRACRGTATKDADRGGPSTSSG